MHFLFLGAGCPFSGKEHTALRFAGSSGRVLDWALQASKHLQVNYTFVSGYQAEQVEAKYPEFNYCFNQDWQTTKAGGSLLLGLKNINSECLVSYADILYRQSTIKALNNQTCDIAIAVDSHWRTRYAGRSAEDLERSEKAVLAGENITLLGAKIPTQIANAEFIGLVKFSENAAQKLKELGNNQHADISKLNLSELIEHLRVLGLSVAAVDVAGDWAQLNEPADLAKFILGTKAQTLSRLQNMVKLSRIEDQVSFRVAEWQANQSQILQQIHAKFNGINLVARSSALSEDGFNNSNAGAYTSILNIQGDSQSAIIKAIETVIASYPDGDQLNEVLVQPMLQNVQASGVIFTRGLNTGAPYYVANYDESGSTESITDGSSTEHKTLVIRRDAQLENLAQPGLVTVLLPALREIESLLGYSSLDIEFAITAEHGLHILQVRPIAVEHADWQEQEQNFYQLLAQAEQKFRQLHTPSPFVLGDKALFGIMPDWNPAEIIGTKPSLLATTLYRELILDEVWATQRAEYGYRDVRPQPLLVSFAGHPYIDVRASFNSFIPASLPDTLAEKLVNFSLNWLEQNPELHDKVEFDVIPTCFDLDFNRWQEKFAQNAIFSAEEFEQITTAYKQLTNQALHSNAQPLADIAKLEERLTKIITSNLPKLNQAFCLLDDAKRYGTLAFSHLARSGFVAVTLLRSAVAIGVISQAEYDSFFSTVKTVSQELTQDAQNCAAGEFAWQDFVEKYGHLRPGTYDLTSPSYHQDAEHYLKPLIHAAKQGQAKQSQASPKQVAVESNWPAALAKLSQALNAAGIKTESEALNTFLIEAIEGREFAKFVFTKNLSAALDAIEAWGQENHLNADSLANTDIAVLRSIMAGSHSQLNLADYLNQLAKLATAQQQLVQAIELPPLLCKTEDFTVFTYPASQANFVGSNSICAACIDLSQADQNADVAGKIVLIPQADPGYDWLFGRQIAGLITMYGGANSHMAIRSAEFNLPAAIGIGETQYQKLVQAQELELNPANRVIRVVR